jgi:inositol phosphorylceramide mannosyltransferase catalytic subunit
VPTGISNDVMGSVPHHPFFLKVIDALPRYNRNWLLPYITVMGSTGPLFLSLMWRHHVDSWPTGADRVRVLFPDEYSKHPWSFFKFHVGNSWHQYDVQIIMWMAHNWVFMLFFGFTLAGIFFSGMWYMYGRLIPMNPHHLVHHQCCRPYEKGHTLYSRRSKLSFWRRLSLKDHDYELLKEYQERLEA